MRKIIALSLFVLSCHAILAQDEKLKKEFEQRSSDWMNAWKAKDTALLHKILAPEFRLLSMVNGELVTTSREKWLSNGPYYILKNFRYYDFDIRIYGNTAIVQSKYDQEATLNGQDRSGTFQITDIWEKNKIGWQVVHRHTNLKTKPPSEQSNSQDHSDVYKTIELIAKAWSKNNLDTLNKYIDEEYVHTDINGIRSNKSEWMNYNTDRKENGASNPSLEFSDTEIKFYNGLAIVTGINSFSGPGFTENVSTESKTLLSFTQVLRKQGAIWKRLRFQATPIKSTK